MSLYKKNLGKTGENLAINFLKSNDYAVIDKNFRSKFGEIDIIARKKNILTFIEVKTKTSLQQGAPYEAVNYWKLKHLKRAINYYILKNNVKNCKLSIGIVSIVLGDNQTKAIKLYELDY